MKPGQRPVSERLNELLREACSIEWTTENAWEVTISLIMATRDIADELEAATKPTVRGIPEDIVGYRAATSDGPNVAVQNYG